MGSNSCTVLMETPLIANGAEISRTGGFVKIAKTNEKYRRLGKININISEGSSQMKLK